MNEDRLLSELISLRQDFEFMVADIQSLRVELVRVLESQRAETEANKKKLSNNGNYLSELLKDSPISKRIYKRMKKDGRPLRREIWARKGLVRAN